MFHGILGPNNVTGVKQTICCSCKENRGFPFSFNVLPKTASLLVRRWKSASEARYQNAP